MRKKHRRTLEAVFAEPVRAGVSWEDIEAMLAACGAEMSEGEGSRVRIALNGVRAVFHRPITRLEIVANGQVVASRSGDGSVTEISLPFRVQVPESAWIAARAESPHREDELFRSERSLQSQRIRPVRLDHMPVRAAQLE